jgi:hypothetical protein
MTPEYICFMKVRYMVNPFAIVKSEANFLIAGKSIWRNNDPSSNHPPGS